MKKREKKSKPPERDAPLSLAGVDFEEAVRALLKTPPPPKSERKKKKP